MKCSRCNQSGHNKSTCKLPPPLLGEGSSNPASGEGSSTQPTTQGAPTTQRNAFTQPPS